MVKTFLKILFGVSVAVALVGLPLLVLGDLRDKMYRTAVEMPAIFYYYRLRAPMVSRDFSLAATHLSSQLELVERFADGRNAMIPGLVSNTGFVMRQATLSKEFAAMRNYLERLAAYQSKLFPAQLWLAEAMLATEPAKAFEPAEHASSLIPTDERPYRVALEAALLMGEEARVGSLCYRYQRAKLGSYHFYDFNTLFFGSGLREFGLEVADSKGDAKLLRQPGLMVGDAVSYEFQFDAPITVATLKFHFATPPGLSIRVGPIRFFLEGRQQFQMAPEQFVVISRNGFAVGKGTVTISRDGETLSIHPKKPLNVLADRVNAALSVSRLDLLDHPACAKIAKGR